MKKLGDGGHLLQDVTARGMAMAKAPLHAVRGKSDEEKQLKNAKTEYSDEAEEIATYTAIEALAETLGDRETAKVARQIRREEERMATFLARQIPILTRSALRAARGAAPRRARSATHGPPGGGRGADGLYPMCRRASRPTPSPAAAPAPRWS